MSTNKLKGCTFEVDRTLLRQGRGSYDYRVDNEAEVAVVKWVDIKAVTSASFCAAITPVSAERSKEDLVFLAQALCHNTMSKLQGLT